MIERRVFGILCAAILVGCGGLPSTDTDTEGKMASIEEGIFDKTADGREVT